MKLTWEEWVEDGWDIFGLARLEEGILSLDLHSLAPVAIVLHEACLLMKMVCIFVLFIYFLFSCYLLLFASWHLEKVLVINISVWSCGWAST